MRTPRLLKTVKTKLGELHHGHCIDVMREMESNTIHLIVTSPPYFLNKEYEKTITYKDYCQLMEDTFIESNKVLIGGGYLVINFGDYFNSGNRFYKADVPACYPATMNFFNWGVTNANMDLQATRIWRKQFAKMGIPFVCNHHPRPIFDYEHIWTFRKRNNSKVEFVNDRKLSQRGIIGEGWKSPAGIGRHCAAFPIELPEWAISVYSAKEGDTVLDMFMGSGTTAIACEKLNRKWVGIELIDEHFKGASDRISKECI